MADSAKKQKKDETLKTLSNGVTIPYFGFGCAFGDWTSKDSNKPIFSPEDAWAILPRALSAGVRHFDTAYVYRTHRHLSNALRSAFQDGSITRDDVFITTKVFHPPADKLFGKTLDMLDTNIDIPSKVTCHVYESLDELGLGYVDLLLMHWPGKFDSQNEEENRKARIRCWKTFEELYRKKATRSIGVSNFTEVHLKQLMEDGATITPHVNQIEFSPYTQWTEIVNYCKHQNITIQAYSPLGSTGAGMLQDPVLVELAEKYGKNPGQLVLRWLTQQGVVCLPRSSSQKRMQSNMDVFDFQIDPNDMARISDLNRGTSHANVSPYSIA